jgi:phage protein D
VVSLAGLLSPGFNQPASCLIEVGESLADIGDIANLVTSVEITTSREEAATGSIVIEDRRKEDGQWMAADSGLFIRWAPIRVSADFQTHIQEIFRGFITQPKPTYPNSGGEATLELMVQDESAALDREQMRTIWGEEAPMSDLDILSQLISPLGLTTDANSGQGQSSRALSQDATPIVFLRERAKANGYDLIFSEGQVYFGPKRLEGEAQAPIMVYAGKATNCLNLEINDDGQRPDKVQFDHAPQEEGAETTTELLEPDVAVLGQTPVSQEGAGLGTPSVWRVSKEGDETEEELRARAQALVNENSFRIRATGELDGSLYGHVLKAGRVVSIDGTGARYGGLYYVDKVVHTFMPDGYRQQFELIRNAVGETESAGGPLSAATSALSAVF